MSRGSEFLSYSFSYFVLVLGFHAACHRLGWNFEYENAMTLDPELLDILVCPLTRSRLRQEGDWLIGETGGLRYPIQDSIPVLLIDKATLPAGVASLDEFKKKYASQIPA